MTRRYSWTVRALFGAAFLYLYFAVYRKPHEPNAFLLLNVFLAYIPVELSFHINARSSRCVFWGVFFFWLAFYPNAPYMITDLFHLAKVDPYIYRDNGTRSGLLLPDLNIWFVFANITMSSLGCLLFGMRSLNDVTLAVMRRFRLRGVGVQSVLVLAVTVLASVGIYLGRFPRLHSADLFLHPGMVFAQLASAWSPGMVAFVVLMTALQMAVWILLALAGTTPGENVVE